MVDAGCRMAEHDACRIGFARSSRFEHGIFRCRQLAFGGLDCMLIIGYNSIIKTDFSISDRTKGASA
ncbi:MAG TPA: hypothetical protein DCG49_01645 [Ruminococcus sp.]|nr:hypothetical protein [Ruminococcus sp.]